VKIIVNKQKVNAHLLIITFFLVVFMERVLFTLYVANHVMICLHTSVSILGVDVVIIFL
jgi:hypothetical protein